MSVEEFLSWDRYRRQKLFPQTRLEYYVAQLTLQVSALGMMWGGPRYKLGDFLFDERLDQQKRQTTAEEGAAVLGDMGGVKVIRLGQRRKKRG